jgi:hypothetical protein
MSDEQVVTIRVKSRTGDIYVRAGRFIPHDRWDTIEVPVDVAATLAKDPWIDARDLPAGMAANEPPESKAATSLERQLEEAHTRIEALEHELATARHTHQAELEKLREAHARDLEETRRRIDSEIREGERRENARDSEVRPPPRRGAATSPR